MLLRGCWAKGEIVHMSEVPDLPPNHVAGMLLDFVPPPQYEPSKPADYYHCVDSVGKT